MRNCFIAAQAPMENTVNDFWQMIYQTSSHSIVMLTQHGEV